MRGAVLRESKGTFKMRGRKKGKKENLTLLLRALNNINRPIPATMEGSPFLALISDNPLLQGLLCQEEEVQRIIAKQKHGVPLHVSLPLSLAAAQPELLLPSIGREESHVHGTSGAEVQASLFPSGQVHLQPLLSAPTTTFPQSLQPERQDESLLFMDDKCGQYSQAAEVLEACDRGQGGDSAQHGPRSAFEALWLQVRQLAENGRLS